MGEYVGNCICVTHVAYDTWGPFVSAGTKGPVVNIYIYMLFIFCRYANPDCDRLRTNIIRVVIYRERRNLCQTTGANPVSTKLFGSCFVL